MKKKILLLLLFVSWFAYSQVDPNSLMGLPTLPTLAAMNAITTGPAGNMVYNLETEKIYLFNGTVWVASGNDNWLTDGNNALAANSFLGTTDDYAMDIRSNNFSILEFGRRQTLGLVQAFPDYTDPDQYMTHVKGSNGVAALQFQASGASFYKPMFFTTTNGSFRLKGSSGGTDLFEIGSGGSVNQGHMEFIIGDDGSEAIIFKRYDYRNGRFHKELFRVQGNADLATAKTRFGININTAEVPLDPTYGTNQNGNAGTTYRMANSTLEVQGSIAKSILTTTTNLTLTEDHHTLVLGGNHTITLPAANSCNGRIYIIKNSTTFMPTISPFIDNSGSTITTIPSQDVLWIQSDGTNWQQITHNKISTPSVIAKTANYTLTLADNSGVLTFNSATDLTLTIPAGLPLGYNISVYQIGAGQVTFVGAGGVSVRNRLSRFKTAGLDAGAGLISTGTNIFHLTGDLKR